MVSKELEEIPGSLAEATESAESVVEKPEMTLAESRSRTESVSSAPSIQQDPSAVSASVSQQSDSVSPTESTASFPGNALGYQRKPVSAPFTTASKGAMTPEASLPTSKLPARTQTAQDFLDWVKTTTDVSKQHEVFFRWTDENRKVLIPFSVRNDLKVSFGEPTVYEKSGSVYWNFYTYVSDILMENEWYAVGVFPLTPSEQKTDLRDYFYPEETNKKIGTYKGLTYAYFDGYQGQDRASSVDTAAWFIKDGMLVRIEALYVNNYKPWNNEWFDYFGFETVEW